MVGAGPVRHFMEMVVAGLSKNPHYSAKEKKEYVEWYRDYFSQFSDEELQALTTTAARDEWVYIDQSLRFVLYIILYSDFHKRSRVHIIHMYMINNAYYQIT